MTKTQQSSGSKFLFWGVLFLVCIALAGQVMWGLFGGFRAIPHLIGIGQYGVWHAGPRGNLVQIVPLAILTMGFFLVWVGVVAPLVYRDAKKRGMDPYLWASIAVFLPFFIGIVIYLVARSNGRITCDNCGQLIHNDYKICPYCSHKREQLCPGCGKSIAPEWKVCPYCESKLQTDA